MMEMDEKVVKQIKKSITDFRLLATKVQKDNKEKSKNLKGTNQVLEASKKNIKNYIMKMKNWKKNCKATRRIEQISIRKQ